MTLRSRSMVLAGVLFSAGILAAVAAVLASPVSGQCRRSPGGTPRRRSFPALRGAIVGTTKTVILDVFGPPPTATRALGSGDYLASETWYYPLDVRERSGMAIRFGGAQDRAVAVEKIWGPR